MDYIPVSITADTALLMDGRLHKSTLRRLFSNQPLDALTFKVESMFHNPGRIVHCADLAGHTMEVHTTRGEFVANVVVHPSGAEARVS